MFQSSFDPCRLFGLKCSHVKSFMLVIGCPHKKQFGYIPFAIFLFQIAILRFIFLFAFLLSALQVLLIDAVNSQVVLNHVHEKEPSNMICTFFEVLFYQLSPRHLPSLAFNINTCLNIRLRFFMSLQALLYFKNLSYIFWVWVTFFDFIDFLRPFFNQFFNLFFIWLFVITQTLNV